MSKGQKVKIEEGPALDTDAGFEGRIRGDLPERTYNFARQVFQLVDSLPHNAKGWTVTKQLLRCGSSIGANVAEADQALTDSEFTHRMSIARKEAGETRFWLRLSRDEDLIKSDMIGNAIGEIEELLRILSTIVKQMHARQAQ